MFTGAACIGEYLKKNCTLKFLNMSFNPIGDVGMSQLMKGLHQNMSLTELHIRECGLSSVGTKCNSCRLEYILLQNLPIKLFSTSRPIFCLLCLFYSFQTCIILHLSLFLCFHKFFA